MPQSVKNQIRSITRLLNKTTDPALRAAKEKQIAQLQAQMTQNAEKQKIAKNVGRYRALRFFGTVWIALRSLSAVCCLLRSCGGGGGGRWVVCRETKDHPKNHSNRKTDQRNN